MSLPCDICFERFDLKTHRPKSLPCGHTFCLQCLQNPSLERKCSTCRKSFTTGPADLPDNTYVIRMIGMMETVNLEPASPVEVKQLERGVAAGEQVVQLLEQMVPLAVDAKVLDDLNAQLVSSRAQLQQMKRAVEAVQQGKLSGAVAATQLQLAKQMEDSHRLLTASSCALHVVDKDGATRRFSLQPNHLARLLLLEQQAHGEEVKEDDTQDNDAGIPVGPPRLSSSSSIIGAHLVDNTVRYISGGKAVIGQEEMYFGDLTPLSAPYVRDLTSLKRLNVSVSCLDPKDASTTSWPDLPLQLEELHISDASADHLRCLARMPRLRSLVVHGYQGDIVSLDPVEPRGRSGVQWLGVAWFQNKYPMLIFLVRAHAASLRTLEIKCQPKDLPHLRQDLARSGLRSLRRLVLVREHNSPSEKKDCDRQRRDIQNALPNVQVLCSKCNTDQYHGETW